MLSIDQDRLENYELFEAIAAEESGDSSAMIRIVNLLLGDEAKKLKDHVRTEKDWCLFLLLVLKSRMSLNKSKT